MGSLGGGMSQSSSSSSTHETRLSKQQADILEKHEAQYQEHFFPELLKGMNDASVGAHDSAVMQGQSRAVNQQTAGAKQQFAQAMAQRGLTGSGTEAQGLASISNTKSQLLADAYYNTQLANQDRKMQFIQLGLGMSPTPTTSAQLGSSSSSSGFGLDGRASVLTG